MFTVPQANAKGPIFHFMWAIVRLMHTPLWNCVTEYNIKLQDNQGKFQKKFKISHVESTKSNT
jgi:hypothetical protein